MAQISSLADNIDLLLPHPTHIMSFPCRSPFVLAEVVKDHLTLMAAFRRVHQKVEKAGVKLDSTTGLPIPTSSAVLFLARALQRFELWVATLDVHSAVPGLREHEIPPLDVLIFLHAYMLSPLNFYEDTISKHKVLARMAEFPLTPTVNLIDKETLELIPTKGQVEYWTRVTSLPFDIPFDGPTSETFIVTCPGCETDVVTLWTDVRVSNEPSSPEEYATPVFNTSCTTCRLNVTPVTLRAGRFLRDIYGACVSGTLLDNSGASADLAAAQVASSQMAECLGLRPNQTVQSAGNAYGWDIARVLEFITSHLDRHSDQHAKFTNALLAYSHPSDFSLDLSKAVLRQARFIFQMSAMGWLEPRRFDDKDDVLLRAMMNYEQFICIEATGVIARWDIDLIWHTHQLSGAKYRADTLRVLGRVLDHDDTQSQDVIASATEHADTAWKARFGQSYLAPLHDPDLISSLAKTVCGGSSGGACIKGGGGGGEGAKGGTKKGGTKGSIPEGEHNSHAILAH